MKNFLDHLYKIIGMLLLGLLIIVFFQSLVYGNMEAQISESEDGADVSQEDVSGIVDAAEAAAHKTVEGKHPNDMIHEKPPPPPEQKVPHVELPPDVGKKN